MQTIHPNSSTLEIRKPSILYLSLNPDLYGPLPKIDPLLITVLRNLGWQITKGTWGRHSEHENLFEKTLGRLEDIIKAFVLLARKRFDILYVATTLDEKALLRDVLLLLAVQCFPVKKVIIEHGSKTAPLNAPGHFLYKSLTRSVIRLSDAILLLSTEEMRTWADFEPKGRYYRVDNPFRSMDKSHSQPPESKLDNIRSRPTLLFAGRLVEEKGVYDLLDALPLILRQIDCHLMIAGAGKKDEIQRRIETANLSQSVSLLGYLAADQLADVYRSASVFILPSYFGEGFPTVIAEAMSFGLPIVTTPVRGVRDHLQDGLNALFVQPRNPRGIANAVLKLLSNPGLCAEMGQANLAKVQDFGPEIIAPRYSEIFSKLLQSGSS